MTSVLSALDLIVKSRIILCTWKLSLKILKKIIVLNNAMKGILRSYKVNSEMIKVNLGIPVELSLYWGIQLGRAREGMCQIKYTDLAAFPSGSALKWQNMRRNYISISIDEWLPRWLSSKEYACQCRRCKFDPWVRKMLWSRIWQPAPVFLPGKFHGQRRLAGYSPQGSKELDMTPLLSTHTPHTKLWRKIWQ